MDWPEAHWQKRKDCCPWESHLAKAEMIVCNNNDLQVVISSNVRANSKINSHTVSMGNSSGTLEIYLFRLVLAGHQTGAWQSHVPCTYSFIHSYNYYSFCGNGSNIIGGRLPCSQSLSRIPCEISEPEPDSTFTGFDSRLRTDLGPEFIDWTYILYIIVSFWWLDRREGEPTNLRGTNRFIQQDMHIRHLCLTIGIEGSCQDSSLVHAAPSRCTNCYFVDEPLWLSHHHLFHYYYYLYVL